MTPQQKEVIQQIQGLRQAAESAGLVDADLPTASSAAQAGPWASLDSLWKGPDVDVEKIAAMGQDTLDAVLEAQAQGQADASLISQALGLARILLPVALSHL